MFVMNRAEQYVEKEQVWCPKGMMEVRRDTKTYISSRFCFLSFKKLRERDWRDRGTPLDCICRNRYRISIIRLSSGLKSLKESNSKKYRTPSNLSCPSAIRLSRPSSTLTLLSPSITSSLKLLHNHICPTHQWCNKSDDWWPIGRVDAFRLEGRGFESRSSRPFFIIQAYNTIYQ